MRGRLCWCQKGWQQTGAGNTCQEDHNTRFDCPTQIWHRSIHSSTTARASILIGIHHRLLSCIDGCLTYACTVAGSLQRYALFCIRDARSSCMPSIAIPSRPRYVYG